MNSKGSDAAATNEGRAQAIGNVQKEVDGAMSTMRENMKAMAEREVQLSDLNDKSKTFQVASGSFAQKAAQLRREQQWQNCKVYLIIASMLLVIIWCVVVYVLRDDHDLLVVFIPVSLAVFAAVACIMFCCVRRW